ncbi:polyA polymerase cid, putative [Entamoeba invadens IP1]|uniref:PolyA polymerase cid, putative n=1 Tax=Entamoeba invadens IP1 TaxID=370355 RepID=A0A0A1UAM4_ENTIV|nr:polyA polymerase cid, putative [Entamoeba invadens IP1]ELP92015.1 polyA polymerase cid, putative [Entamoeba invadens IP1]|eukprot:XP_004258786.1 polyA polymerase cid, putative [Entamoeba invadens IP1]
MSDNTFQQQVTHLVEHPEFLQYIKSLPVYHDPLELDYLKSAMKRKSFTPLIETLEKLIYVPGKIVPYGSSYFDFFDGQNDVDTTFLTSEFPTAYVVKQNEDAFNYYKEQKSQKLSVAYQVFNCLQQMSKTEEVNMKNLVIVDRALVPIISLTLNGCDVDISIDNFDGIYNSEIVKSYFSVHPKVRAFVREVKQFHKENKLINPKNGLFNSFSIVLLVLFFLLNKELLPELQNEELMTKTCDGHKIREYKSVCSTCPVKWFECEKCYENYRKKWDVLLLDDLLVEYFAFYLSFDFTKKITIFPSYFKTPENEKSSISVISPFLPFLNLTRKFDTQLVQLLNCYRIAAGSFSQKLSNCVFAIAFEGDIPQLLTHLEDYKCTDALYFYPQSDDQNIVFVKFLTKALCSKFVKDFNSKFTHNIKSIQLVNFNIITFVPSFEIAIKYTKKYN